MKKTITILPCAVMVLAVLLTAVPVQAEAASGKLAAPVINLMSIVTKNNLWIKWGKVSKATHYRVYRATSLKGKYKKLRTVKKTGYTDKTVQPGKTYYYKIRAVLKKPSGKVYNGPKSKPVPVKISTKRPTVKTSVKGSSKIEISWDAINDVTKYRVMTSTRKTTGYQSKTVTGVTSYTKTGLTKGKKYYFKVRMVTRENGVTYLGLPSAPKAATPKVTNSQKATQLGKLVNQARQDERVQPLTVDPLLQKMAMARAKEIVYFNGGTGNHTRPDGSYYRTIVDEFGYTRKLEGEVIAAPSYQLYKGRLDVAMDAWHSSPGHWDSLMEHDYTYMGCGYYEKGEYSYCVVLFATDYDSPEEPPG